MEIRDDDDEPRPDLWGSELLLRDALDEPDPESRRILVLRHYAGASWEAIAEETGRPSASAARMMHAKALLELGKLLRKRGIRGEGDAVRG